MKIISFICFSLFSSYAFSDSCQKTFSNLKTKRKASIEIAQTEAFKSNAKISKLKSKTKISTSKISNIYFREKFQDEKYTLKYLKKMNNLSSIQKIAAIYPVLTGKEQIELAKVYKEYQDVRSLQILFFSNFRLIYKMINKKIGPHHYKFDDYFQESNLAFLQAIQLFDPYQEIQFSTYLTQAINNNLNRYNLKDASLKISSDLKYKIYLLHQEQQANPEMFGKDLWIENVIKKYPKEGFTKARIREILLHHFDKNREPIYQFINTSINKNREEKEESIFEIENFSDPKDQESLDPSQLNLPQLRVKYGKLDQWVLNEIQSHPRQKVLQRIWESRIFYLRMTLKEIADEFGISKNYTQKLESNLRKKINEHFDFGRNF